MSGDLTIESAALTDCGRRRSHNEDAVLACPEVGLFAVADGMGGAVGGEAASHEVIRCLGGVADMLAPRPPGPGRAVELLGAALQEANATVFTRARQAGATGMGSTVVLLFIDCAAETATVLHAGDSRAYRFRDGELRQLTEDHSLVAEVSKRLAASGASVPLRWGLIDGQLTRAVGLEERLVLDRQSSPFSAGDVFLLCSDGLTKHLPDADIHALLEGAESSDVQSQAQRLVDTANERGGDDNVSVVLAAVRPLSGDPQSLTDKFARAWERGAGARIRRALGTDGR